MGKAAVRYSGGNCVPDAAGVLSYSVEKLDGWRLRYTVSVVPYDGYEFVRWEFDIPELWEGAYFDPDVLSAIQSQSNSQTIVWDDPEEFDGGYGIVFIAHMRRQGTSSGEILHGRTNFPIYGKNDTLLFKDS